MPRIQIIDPVQDPRWDRFVEGHPFGWICHLSGWKQVLESTFRHMQGYYFALMGESGEGIVAGLPVFHVKSRILGDRLVGIPFATLCDPLVSTPIQFAELSSQVLDLAHSFNVQCIEIRTLSAGHLVADPRLSRSETYRLHYLDLRNSIETLKKKFHPSCVARGVRRSMKGHLKHKMAENDTDLAEFFRLHRLTRKNAGLPLHPYRLFKAMWDVFAKSGRIRISLAVMGDRAIGGILSLKYKNRVSCDYVAFDLKHKQHRPNHFLYWHAIQAAAAEGFSVFDFGRTAENNFSLMKFKERWGAASTPLPQFFYPPREVNFVAQYRGSIKQKLLTTACRHAPGFVQKAIGEFCYRHLG
jgi:CelD/BcsL family acetyltransferase involved in cellulose biosynthesis